MSCREPATPWRGVRAGEGNQGNRGAVDELSEAN